MLDRSFKLLKNRSPSYPELITNGAFDSDVSGWALSNGFGSFTFSAGKGLTSATGGDCLLYQTIGLVIVIGTYRLMFDVTELGGATPLFYAQSGNGIGAGAPGFLSQLVNSNGSKQFDFSVGFTDATNNVNFNVINACTFKIDNISLKRLT